MASCFGCCRVQNEVQIAVPKGAARNLQINHDQVIEIQDFINRGMPAWINRRDQATLHIGKSGKIEVDLYVFNTAGKVHVMVVNNWVILGLGGRKVVYVAYDWLEEERCVLAKSYGGSSTAKEVAFQRYLAEAIDGFDPAVQEQITSLNPIGTLVFADGDGYFARCVDKTLGSMIEKKSKLTDYHFLCVMNDVVDTLFLFQLKGIEHRDIHVENILYEDGHAYFIDFGESHVRNPILEEAFPNRGKVQRLFFGSKAPELYRYSEMNKNGMPNLEQLHDESWLKHDIWSAGRTLIHLKAATNRVDWKRDHEEPHTILDAALANKQIAPADLADEARFTTLFKEPALISEPAKKGPSYFLWQMVQYDHRKRPTAAQLRAEFQGYLRQHHIVL